MDRRKKRTRNAIKNACVQLTKEKGFDNMSISDIAERADINRATFYLHFLDKLDMLNQFEDEVMDTIKVNFDIDLSPALSIEEIIQTRYKAIVNTFVIFKEHQDIIGILFETKGIKSIQERFYSIFYKMFEHQFTKVQLRPSFQSPELFITVVVSTMIGIAHYSINSNETKTPENLAISLITIIINGPARTAGFIQNGFIDVEAIINK